MSNGLEPLIELELVKENNCRRKYLLYTEVPKSLCRQAGLPPRQKIKILPAEFHYVIKRSTKVVFSSLIP